MTAYKNHKPGSRKGKVHRRFDRRGEDAAVEYGLSLGLAQSTLKSWINAWKGPKAHSVTKSDPIDQVEQPKPKRGRRYKRTVPIEGTDRTVQVTIEEPTSLTQIYQAVGYHANAMRASEDEYKQMLKEATERFERMQRRNKGR